MNSPVSGERAWRNRPRQRWGGNVRWASGTCQALLQVLCCITTSICPPLPYQVDSILSPVSIRATQTEPESPAWDFPVSENATYIQLCTEVLFIIPKRWEQPKRLTAGKWINYSGTTTRYHTSVRPLKNYSNHTQRHGKWSYNNKQETKTQKYKKTLCKKTNRKSKTKRLQKTVRFALISTHLLWAFCGMCVHCTVNFV